MIKVNKKSIQQAECFFLIVVMTIAAYLWKLSIFLAKYL